jgi:broad specificity phosphatase PhoE
MKKKYPGNGDILLVSHAGFIHEFIANIFNICPQNIGNKYGKYKNCSITSIEVDGKTRPYLELMLYTKYLDGI